MSANAALDVKTMQIGLLMEAAQSHQQLVEASLQRLRAHTAALDGLVREEIRRTCVEELGAVVVESTRAADALRAVTRTATLRIAFWSFSVIVLSVLFPAVAGWWLSPSPAQLASLRARRDQLALAIAGLEQRGGRIDVQRCGETARLCVRVDRQAPAYGEKADYFVVKGY